MIDKIPIALDEQELTINYYPTDDSVNCEVYTTIPWAMKYLERMVKKYPDTCKLLKDDQYSYTVKMPFKLCKPRAPRIMTAEQKETGAKRLAEARMRKEIAVDTTDSASD
jgi:hypothetical protein